MHPSGVSLGGELGLPPIHSPFESMPTEKNPFSAAGTPWLEDGRTAHWTPSRPSPEPSDLPLPCGSRRKVLSEKSHITPYEASSDSQKQCRKCVDSDAYPAEQAALLADAQTIWLQSLKCRQSALQHEMEGIVNKLHLLKSSLRDVPKLRTAADKVDEELAHLEGRLAKLASAFQPAGGLDVKTFDIDKFRDSSVLHSRAAELARQLCAADGYRSFPQLVADLHTWHDIMLALMQDQVERALSRLICRADHGMCQRLTKAINADLASLSRAMDDKKGDLLDARLPPLEAPESQPLPCDQQLQALCRSVQQSSQECRQQQEVIVMCCSWRFWKWVTPFQEMYRMIVQDNTLQKVYHWDLEQLQEHCNEMRTSYYDAICRAIYSALSRYDGRFISQAAEIITQYRTAYIATLDSTLATPGG